MLLNAELLLHDVLVKDFNAVIKDGLNAKVLQSTWQNSTTSMPILLQHSIRTCDADEKKYLWLVKKRIEEGSLSDLIRADVLKRAKKTDFHEAIVDVYSTLIKCLSDNEPYF